MKGNHEHAKWVALSGTIDGKAVCIAVLCHAVFVGEGDAGKAYLWWAVRKLSHPGIKKGRLESEELNLKKMDVSSAVETLKIKIKPCQLGAY